jgi:preprotein translocase subunit SecE
VTEARGALTPGRGGADQPERKERLPARVSLFYRQVIAELRKVIWPTRRELVVYTCVVLVFVIIVITYITGLDLLFGELVLRVFG